MAEIASLLAKEGLKLVRPDTTTGSAPDIIEEDPEGVSESEDELQVSFDNSVRTESSDEEMAPSSILKNKKSAPGSPGLSSRLNSMSLDTASRQPVVGSMTNPVLSGRWETFDYNTDQESGFVLMRMLVHNGCGVNDFKTCFTDPRSFSIKKKWPQYMRNCLMMTSLDTTPGPNGQPFETYPQTHPLYTDMGKNAKALKEDDNEIWSEGNFYFKRNMDMFRFEPKLFEVPLGGNNNGHVTILQIKFYEQQAEEKKRPFASPPIAKTNGSINFRNRKSPNQQQRRRPPPPPAPAPAAAPAPPGRGPRAMAAAVRGLVRRAPQEANGGGKKAKTNNLSSPGSLSQPN